MRGTPSWYPWGVSWSCDLLAGLTAGRSGFITQDHGHGPTEHTGGPR